MPSLRCSATTTCHSSVGASPSALARRARSRTPSTLTQPSWASAEPCSSSASDEIYRRAPGARRPIVIPKDVDADYFVLGPATGLNEETLRTVGWLGRLHPHKDVCTGTRAFAAFCGKSVSSRSIRMIIGGTGPDEPKARNLARELGVSSGIEFRGAVNDARSFLNESPPISLQFGHRGRKRAMERYSMIEMVTGYREVLLGEALPEVAAVSADDGREA